MDNHTVYLARSLRALGSFPSLVGRKIRTDVYTAAACGIHAIRERGFGMGRVVVDDDADQHQREDASRFRY